MRHSTLLNAAVGALFATSLLAGTANAACDAKDDPCAPKKAIDSWTKSLAAGLNYSSGNSDTAVVSILSQAGRETKEDILDFTASYGYGEDRSKEEKKNKDEARAGASYKYLLGERLYAGAGANFLRDDIADVAYRVTVAPTIGYFLLKDADFKLSAEVGPGYTFEEVAKVDNDYFSPKLGERFEWTISCTSKLFQGVDVLLDTTDMDNTLVNAEVGVEAALSSSLSLVVLVRDTYDNLPALDREKNDVTVISALKVAF